MKEEGEGGGREGKKGGLTDFSCHLQIPRHYGTYGFMVMGFVSGLSLASHSDSESFLVAHALAQPRWVPERRILGGGQKYGVSF